MTRRLYIKTPGIPKVEKEEENSLTYLPTVQR